jgi:hypothetical protein
MDQLPEEACPIVLIVTDGTVAAPDLTSYDNVVMDMNARDTTCSIICVHDPHEEHPPVERYPFGVVPDYEALRFLCTMTGGTFTYAGEQAVGGAGSSAGRQQPHGQQQGRGGEFILADAGQLARRVKSDPSAGRVCADGGGGGGDGGDGGGEPSVGSPPRPTSAGESGRLRFSMFVRCHSMDGECWKRNGHLPPTPRNSRKRGGRTFRHDRLGVATSVREAEVHTPRMAGFDASTDWHWYANKEVRYPIDTLASMFYMRLFEGFVVSRISLKFGPPHDESGLADWSLSLQMNSVWEPLRAGIEWSIDTAGCLVYSKLWAAQSREVQRLLLMNRLLHPLRDEPGWIAELEMPFEAGITRVDGRPLKAQLHNPRDTYVDVSFRLWPTEKLQRGSNRVPLKISRFMTQMTVGVDANVLALCRNCVACADADRRVKSGGRSQDCEQNKLMLIQLAATLAGGGIFNARRDGVAGRRCFGSAHNVHFWVQPKVAGWDKSAGIGDPTAAEMTDIIGTLDEVFAEASARWCHTEWFGRRQIAIDEFKKLDTHNHGFLSFGAARTALERIYRSTGVEITDDELASAALASTNTYGSTDAVSFEEFLECWRIKNRCLHIKLLSGEDWGDVADWQNDADEQSLTDDVGYLQSATSSTSGTDDVGLPSFCFVTYRWVPDTACFTFCLRFFRVPLHDTRVKLVHQLICTVQQRAASLPFNIDVAVAPKSLRNVLLAGSTVDSDRVFGKRLSDPRIGGIPRLQDISAGSLSSESALRSYLCRFTWMWKIPESPWIRRGSENSRETPFLEKFVAALYSQWKRSGFWENSKASKLLIREFVCRNDPLDMYASTQNRHRNDGETFNSTWEQWQYWHKRGNVRSIVQYSASVASNETLRVEAWVEPMCLQNEEFLLTAFYRMPDHTLARHREPQLVQFYTWLSGQGHKMSTGATNALVEQFHSHDEACLTAIFTFDCLIDMCERRDLRHRPADTMPYVHSKRPSQSLAATLCTVCRANVRQERSVFTPCGKYLCGNCARDWQPDIPPVRSDNVTSFPSHDSSPWNREVLSSSAQFQLMAVLESASVIRREFATPTEGTWTLPAPSLRTGLPVHKMFIKQMLRAFASVFDFELWLSEAELRWLGAQSVHQHQEGFSAPQCFVKRVGTHRLLVSFACANARGVSLVSYECSQPTTAWQPEHAAWGEHGICFESHCRFCRAEGYAPNIHAGGGTPVNSPANGPAQPVSDGKPRQDETVCTWFLQSLDFVYSRVYVAVMTELLDTHAGVKPEELNTALKQYLLSFGVELDVPRLTSDSVPIDMTKLHRVMWQRTANSLVSFYNTDRSEVVGGRRTSADIQPYTLNPDSKSSKPILRHHSDPNSGSTPANNEDGHTQSVDSRKEPQLWLYYRSEVDKDSELSNMERRLLSTLANLNLSPVGPAEGSLFCSTAHTISSSSRVVSGSLAEYTQKIPSEQEIFIDPCISGPLVAQAKGQYETNMSAWLRSFAEAIPSRSPMFLSVVVKDIAGAHVKCVLRVRAHVLLPIRLTTENELSDFADDLRIKSSLPIQQRSALLSLLESARSVVAEVLLHHMPSRTMEKDSVDLVTQAMADLQSGASRRLVATGSQFLRREFRLHFENKSAQTNSILLDNLRNTNLLQLKEIREGFFVVLERPQLLVRSGRVEEPLGQVLGDTDGARDPCDSSKDDIAPPFWCFLDTKRGRSTVWVSLFSSRLTRADHIEFVNAIDASLSTLSQRANVNYLLNVLNETRICDPTLFDPNEEASQKASRKSTPRRAPANSRWQVEQLTEQDMQTSEHEDQAGKARMYRFPLLHTIVLHLDGRVPADDAMRELCKTLRPFEIENRDRAFVYAANQKGKDTPEIFYLRLLQQEDKGERATTDGVFRERTMTAPPTFMQETGLSQHHDEPLERGDSAPVEQSDESQQSAHTASISVQMYGIYTPSSQLISELRIWLQSRLESLALSALSALLRRDLCFEITAKDVAFMCEEANGSIRAPSSVAMLSLPAKVTKVQVFLSMLQENLASTKLVHPMQFQSKSGYVQKSNDTLPGTTASDTNESVLHPFDCSLDQSTSQLRMFYNYQKERGAPGREDLVVVGKLYGEGLAFISISLLAGDIEVETERRTLEFSSPMPLWPDSDSSGSTVGMRVRLPRSGASVGSTPSKTPLSTTARSASVDRSQCLRVFVQLWSKGAVNAEELMSCVELSANRALHEYCLDVACLGSFPHGKGTDVAHIGSAFGHTLAHGAPSVRYFSVCASLPWSYTLPPRSCADFIHETIRVLHELGEGVTVCVEQKPGNNSFAVFSPPYSTEQMSRTSAGDKDWHAAVASAQHSCSVVMLGTAHSKPSSSRRSTAYEGTLYPDGESLRRNSFCLVECKGRVWAHTYNWPDRRVYMLQEDLSRLMYWMCTRSMLLGHVLCAKMGLDLIARTTSDDTPLEKTAFVEHTRPDRTYAVAWTGLQTPKGHRSSFIDVAETGGRCAAKAIITAWSSGGRTSPGRGVSNEDIMVKSTLAYRASEVAPHTIIEPRSANQASWFQEVVTQNPPSADNQKSIGQLTWPWRRLQLQPTLKFVMDHAIPPVTTAVIRALVDEKDGNVQVERGRAESVYSRPAYSSSRLPGTVLPPLDISLAIDSTAPLSARKPLRSLIPTALPHDAYTMQPQHSKIEWIRGSIEEQATDLLPRVYYEEFETALDRSLGAPSSPGQSDLADIGEGINEGTFGSLTLKQPPGREMDLNYARNRASSRNVSGSSCRVLFEDFQEHEKLKHQPFTAAAKDEPFSSLSSTRFSSLQLPEHGQEDFPFPGITEPEPSSLDTPSRCRENSDLSADDQPFGPARDEPFAPGFRNKSEASYYRDPDTFGASSHSFVRSRASSESALPRSGPLLGRAVGVGNASQKNNWRHSDRHESCESALRRILDDDIMQHHLQQLSTHRVAELKVPSENRLVCSNKSGDLLQVVSCEVEAAIDAGRKQMRQHLHQASLLRKLRDDAHAAAQRLSTPTSYTPRTDQQRLNSHRFDPISPLMSARTIDPTQLEFNLRNAARLLHTCRWPLLFNDARQLLEASSVSWPQQQGSDDCLLDSVNSSASLTVEEGEAVALYRRQLESVLHYYTQYLRSVLAFQLVCVLPSSDQAAAPPPPPAAATDDQSPCLLHSRAAIMVGGRRLVFSNSPRVYLCKAVAGSEDVTGDGRSDAVIVLQLQFDGIFVCADLYAPEEWPPGRQCRHSTHSNSGGVSQLGADTFRPNRRSAETRWLHTVDDAAIKVQQNLHFQSFLYDFHLHHVCLEILRPPDTPPNFGILELLRALSRHHTATAVAGAPRGALGALRHQPREVIELPYSLHFGARRADHAAVAHAATHGDDDGGGGELNELPAFLAFVVRQCRCFGCRDMQHRQDSGCFCVASSRPPSEWWLDAEHADDGVACLEGMLGNAKYRAADDALGKTYFCVVHVLDWTQHTEPSTAAAKTRSSLTVELFVGRAGGMEGYCPKLRRGKPFPGSGAAVARLPPAAAARYVRQIFEVSSRQFQRQRLWRLLQEPGAAPPGPSPSRLQQWGAGAWGRSIADSLPELLGLCYQRRVDRFDRRLRWLCEGRRKHEHELSEPAAAAAAAPPGRGAPPSSVGRAGSWAEPTAAAPRRPPAQLLHDGSTTVRWAAFVRYLAESCDYAVAVVEVAPSVRAEPQTTTRASGRARWDCVMCDMSSHDVAIQMRFCSDEKDDTRELDGGGSSLKKGGRGIEAAEILESVGSTLRVEDTWVIGQRPLETEAIIGDVATPPRGVRVVERWVDKLSGYVLASLFED